MVALTVCSSLLSVNLMKFLFLARLWPVFDDSLLVCLLFNGTVNREDMQGGPLIEADRQLNVKVNVDDLKAPENGVLSM